MAIGQIVTLPTGQSTLVKTQSQEESQSVAVLNPNDGVVYLKINAPSGLTAPSWDWKLPSQSYGLFPGPWLSLGVTYVDQSGSGRSGEMNIYDASTKLVVPIINAIGRAVQSAGTAMDISQGGQPANPPANVGRLWIDAAGNAWILYSDGSMVHLVDTNDALGGVLTGFLPNPGMANGVVGTAQLADNQVTSAKLATNSVTSAHIVDGTISTADIADNNITSAKLAVNSVVSAHIVDGTIQNADLAGGVALANLAVFSILVRIATFYTNVTATYGPTGWQESVIQASGTFTGARIRIDFGCSIQNNTAGAYVSVGIGWDGVVQTQLTSDYYPNANASNSVSGTIYLDAGLSAGVHRLALFINSNAGNAVIQQNPISWLFATEERR